MSIIYVNWWFFLHTDKCFLVVNLPSFQVNNFLHTLRRHLNVTRVCSCNNKESEADIHTTAWYFLGFNLDSETGSHPARRHLLWWQPEQGGQWLWDHCPAQMRTHGYPLLHWRLAGSGACIASMPWEGSIPTQTCSMLGEQMVTRRIPCLWISGWSQIPTVCGCKENVHVKRHRNPSLYLKTEKTRQAAILIKRTQTYPFA